LTLPAHDLNPAHAAQQLAFPPQFYPKSTAAASGRACGAFSNALQAVLAAHPAPMSNRELVRRARRAGVPAQNT